MYSKKTWFIREENSSPKCQTPSNLSICSLKSVSTTNCSQVETPMRTTSTQMSFPETVSDSLCRNDLVIQTDCCSSCPGGWSQMILEVKMLDVEVLGLCGYTWSAVVRPVGWTAKFSETPLEMAYGSFPGSASASSGRGNMLTDLDTFKKWLVSIILSQLFPLRDNNFIQGALSDSTLCRMF